MREKEGGKIARAATPKVFIPLTTWKPVLLRMLRKQFLVLLLFFLAVGPVLSSVKKPYNSLTHSRWNQNDFLILHFLVWKSLCKWGKKATERYWEKCDEGISGNAEEGRWLSSFYMDVFHLLFSSLFPPLCLPYLTFSVLLPTSSTSKPRQRKKHLPSFPSLNFYMQTSVRKISKIYILKKAQMNTNGWL